MSGNMESIEALALTLGTVACSVCGHAVQVHDSAHICWYEECDCERDEFEVIAAWVTARDARVAREAVEAAADAWESLGIPGQMPPAIPHHWLRTYAATTYRAGGGQ